jgi:hypothetical protein
MPMPNQSDPRFKAIFWANKLALVLTIARLLCIKIRPIFHIHVPSVALSPRPAGVNGRHLANADLRVAHPVEGGKCSDQCNPGRLIRVNHCGLKQLSDSELR